MHLNKKKRKKNKKGKRKKIQKNAHKTFVYLVFFRGVDNPKINPKYNVSQQKKIKTNKI